MPLIKSTSIFLVLFYIYGIAASTDCDSDEDNSECTTEGEDEEKKWYPINIKFALSKDWVIKEWTFCVPKKVALFIKKVMSGPTNETKSLNDLRYKVVLRASEKGITKEEKDQRAKEKNLLMYLLRRQWNVRPLTEIGPGAFKHDIKNYPPGALAKEMTKLLALKKRQEDKAKDLNNGNEN